MIKPLLSIGIIFKNDIRCIEHCLKCLQPLRDVIPCELVMADTGSEDGSRKIAERYADILIDFPWVDDFSVARNAVMDRCSGEWYFSVDTDEYLREDISELKEFLMQGDAEAVCATVMIRNFNNYELTGAYSDLMALRIVRLSLGVRYQGAIHEAFSFGSRNFSGATLNRTILDHDGYVGFSQSTEIGRAKIKRNVDLIHKELKKHPNDLLLHMQLIESGISEPDYIEHIRQTIEMVREKGENWEKLGPPIIRHAVIAANEKKLPELDEWVQLAQEWFPGSMYTRLDVEWTMFTHSWNKKDYDDCVLRGERFLIAMEDYRAGKDPGARIVSTLQSAFPSQEQRIKILLSYAHCHSSDSDFHRAFELLTGLDYTIFDENQTSEMLMNLHELHCKSDLDTSDLITTVWDGILEPQPSQTLANQRKAAFIQTASLSFAKKNRALERENKDFHRHAYTLYTPLHDKCEIGIAAAVMEMSSSDMIKTQLDKVDNWELFPASALLHSLECGTYFPLPGRPLETETMESLAARIAKGVESFFSVALETAERAKGELHNNSQHLNWAKAVLMTAIQRFPWSDQERDEEQGMAIARAFAQIEGEFLPMCYHTEVLQEDRLFLLPPLHRFGWYCSRAFEVLGKGGAVEYVRLLHAGLERCESMKNMVEFLVNHTQEVQQLLTPPELKVLADQVRVILARFAPDDPAVAALKQSEAYQKVAHLIEGMSVPVWGGLLQ
jgi:glycosyltransferase involved in cell wall biosynthesis